MSTDHAAAALRVLEAANGMQLGQGMGAVAQAQVLATLAVADACKPRSAEPVEPSGKLAQASTHYCSDRALLDMIESREIPERDKPPLRAELAVRMLRMIP